MKPIPTVRRARQILREGGARALQKANAAYRERRSQAPAAEAPAAVPEPVIQEWLGAPSPARPADSPNDATVSVIIPSYQHAAFIREAILSVDRQTYPHIQLVIVDDGSTDNSIEIIEATLAEISIVDVVFEKQANQGAAATINRGISLARGRFVSILNSDDAYHPDRLSRLHAHATTSGAEFVFSEVVFSQGSDFAAICEEANHRWLQQLDGVPTLGFALLQFNGTCSSSNFFLSRELFNRVGPLRDLLLVSDWDYALRAVLDSEPAIVREPLLYYRLHESNTMTNRSSLQRSVSEYRDVLRNYFQSIQAGEPRNAIAPSPEHFGDLFFDFLVKPGDVTPKHWTLPKHESLWRTASLDLLPAQDAFTPPLELMELVGSVSADGYHQVGEEFLSYFIEYADLEPDADILDIGCGSGRIAIPLTAYLNDRGSYTGFDIVPSAIDWCRETITPEYPKFQFDVADVRNTFYNPDGPVSAAEYTFPYDDHSFDFAFLTSVFTHVLPAEFERYVAEISRTLRPGGRCLATFFLENEEANELISGGKSTLSFPFHRDGFRTISAEHPEFAIMFPQQYVLEVLARNGLAVSAFYFGSWCGRDHFTSYQDFLLLERVERPLAAVPEATPSDAVQYVCVSHRPEIFEKYVGSNTNIPANAVQLYDNTTENVGIASRYNDFIDNQMGDGWVVFMHHDMQFDEPLQPRLSVTPRDSIYGVIGTVVEQGRRYVHFGGDGRKRPKIERGAFTRIRIHGLVKCLKTLSPSGYVGEKAVGLPIVDTVDCCCVIVHSSLIRKHRLRFDPDFPWHFYSEKFSLDARENHGVRTRAIQIDCGHYGHGEIDGEFKRCRQILIDTFGEGTFSSTCYVPPQSVGGIARFTERRGLLIQY
ncbi:glycosyltransferase [Smaragdicoccus niigatensis]|uniref:glycosyltransferase n=1 Tax=Smaragdicoccus niigatensis TaxID=359359 RepID=UPI000370A0BF|nr:glycosyltransferase [Smaragdicoccus niigatensis]